MPDPQIEYRTMRPNDADQVFNLITDTFHQTVAPGFSQEGIDEFLTCIQPDILVDHLEKHHAGFLALLDTRIVGMIMLRNDEHISLFFVDPEFQRQGIGRALMRLALAHRGNHEPEAAKITVNASPNSVNAYKRLGFEVMDTEQCLNGIRFVPMALKLNPM